MSHIQNSLLMQDYLRDALGYIDDFRATPGEVGMPLSRKIYLKANISSLLKEYLDKLNEQGYSKEEVEEVLCQVINDSYPEDLA